MVKRGIFSIYKISFSICIYAIAIMFLTILEKIPRSFIAVVNPIHVKAALEKMGYGRAIYRQPLDCISQTADARLTTAMKEAGLVG